MLLNTATAVTVRFDKRERNIRLISGEALFEVAHDKTRPFLVHVDDIAARAVGTAFVVRIDPVKVSVTVTEGIVEVAAATSILNVDPFSSTTLRPGAKSVAANTRVIFAGSSRIEVLPVSRSETERQLAWRDGMVSFDGESLQTAVTEINRYNRKQTVIDDLTLAAKTIVGVYRATDPDGFCATVAAAFKINKISGDTVIRLQWAN